MVIFLLDTSYGVLTSDVVTLFGPAPIHGHAGCFPPLPSGRDDGGDRLPRRMQAYGCARAMGYLALFSHGLGLWLLPTIFLYIGTRGFVQRIILSPHSGNFTPGDVSPVAVANF